MCGRHYFRPWKNSRNKTSKLFSLEENRRRSQLCKEAALKWQESHTRLGTREQLVCPGAEIGDEARELKQGLGGLQKGGDSKFKGNLLNNAFK